MSPVVNTANGLASTMALNGVLLFGAGGQLGHELARALTVVGPVTGLTRHQVDLSQPDLLRSMILAQRPAVIVNAAAYTAVDQAEQSPALAQAINATAPGVMAEAAVHLGAVLVHYSTDYVFNGQSQRPYLETDPTDPQSVYGRTKRDGDLAVMHSGARHVLLRSSWVVGVHGQNFLKTMLRLAQERDSLAVVSDQVGVPTSAAWMADTTVLALQQGLQGLFHLTPAGQTNWHAYAQYLLNRAQQMGWPLKVTANQVQAISTAEYPLPAPRPASSLMDSRLLAHSLNIELPPWQQGVNQVLESLRPVSSSGSAA